MKIKGLKFICTCSICPEQYDVFADDGKMVGYVRLRFGSLTCNYPDVGGECIYQASIGSEWAGCFGTTEQQMEHLSNIADKILEKMKGEEHE